MRSYLIMNSKVLLFIFLVSYGTYQSWSSRAIVHGVGEVAQELPTQKHIVVVEV